MAPPRPIFNRVIRGDDISLREWLEPDEPEPGLPRDVNQYFFYDLEGGYDDEADIDAGAYYNRATLLHCAVSSLVMMKPDYRNHPAVVRLLLAHGADVNAVDMNNDTPLLLCDDHVLSEILLDAGADVNARSDDGNYFQTALMLHAKNSEMARLLVSRGADLYLQDELGRDAEALARERIGGEISSPKVADFLADVRAAGSWFRYVRAPRVELLLLRFAVARGRATPPPVRLRTLSPETVIFERLFGASAEDPRALPLEVFWLVLAFWRTDRDV